MRRTETHELLDDDAGSPAEVATALADLRRINRWFGGMDTSERLLLRAFQRTGCRSLSLLEVAAGAGDVPRSLQTRIHHRGFKLEVTLLDRAASHLRNGFRKESLPAVAGDALALPFQEHSFDLVGCSLFAHHLSPHQLLQFVAEALRVCRIGLLINDLIRHPLHLWLVYAGMPLYRSRLTRHDAPASVRQSYTREEMGDLLKKSAAAHVEIHSHYLFRMEVAVWKKRSFFGNRSLGDET